MFVIIGYIFMCACILGAYVVHGGHLAVFWQPSELVIIFGGAIGGMIAAQGAKGMKQTVAALPLMFKNTPYTKPFFMDLFAMMFEILSKVRKEGLMSIETDIEDPHSSPIISKYPSIEKDHHLTEFLCDYLRLMVGGNLNSMEIENLMDVELDAHHADAHVAVDSITKLADGLPAFGIVAAVMGVVHVMGSLHLPPPALGELIGAALVGTFMGIWLAYGFVGPLATVLEKQGAATSIAFQAVKVTLLASLNGYAPQVAVEFGRKALSGSDRPSFKELEEHVKNAKGK